MMNIKVQNKFMGNIMETHMKIIGLGGFANVGKTTILKSLIDELKKSGLDLKSTLTDRLSSDDLHVIFENKDKDDIIFIATGGDSASHVLNNINEAKRNEATILVTPYRISRNADVQDIIIEDPEAILIAKPKYPSSIPVIYGSYVRRLKSYLI